MVACCLCGVAIEPNDAMMCLPCLRLEVARETQGSLDAIEREVVRCPKCYDWKRDTLSQHYFPAELESVELLTHLVKRVRKLKHLSVQDACFEWTEPHSKRIRVRVVYEQEVLGQGTKVSQAVVLEFRVRDRLCRTCGKLSDKDGWSSIVQIRQHAASVGVLLRLERDVRESGLHLQAAQIGTTGSGLDMTFNEDKHAHDLVRFVRSRAPSQYQQSTKVVSTDIKSGNHNIKHTHLVTVAPINVHDLVVLPKKLAAAVGGVGRLALCTGVSNQLSFVDVGSGGAFHSFIITAAQYFRDPFTATLNAGQLTRFTVLDFELAIARGAGGRRGGGSGGGGGGGGVGGGGGGGGGGGAGGSSRGKGSKKKRERRRRAQQAAMERAGRLGGGGSGAADLRALEPTREEGGAAAPAVTAAVALEAAPPALPMPPVDGQGVVVADAEVAREEDLGENDDTFRVRTHVGGLLEVGEVVYGYNLDSTLSMFSDQLGMRAEDLPSVVLVKGEDAPDPKKRKNRGYRGKKENFNSGRPVAPKQQPQQQQQQQRQPQGANHPSPTRSAGSSGDGSGVASDDAASGAGSGTGQTEQQAKRVGESEDL